MIKVDRSSETPLHRQLYLAIRSRILSGAFPPGLQLPASRNLAHDLGISRATVVEAFEQLTAEGYLVARVGAGSFVAPGAGGVAPATGSVAPAAGVSASPGAIPHGAPLSYRSDLIDFRTGLPELDAFPVALWQRLTREVLDRVTRRDLAYGQPEGLEELRGAISRYLVARRGLKCGSGQIVVVAGTTQAVGLITKLLCNPPPRDVLLEDPVTNDIRFIVEGNGGAGIPIPVDDHGMRTDLLPALSPAFVYVTPSHHFPLGGILPIQRRHALISYVRARGAYILEDDYDTEFRYEGHPVSSLQELAPERVIYVGTFSKTVFPALRLGFIVLPAHLVDLARKTKWFSDLHNPVIEQKVLARFIAEGHFERHIQRSKRRLSRRFERCRLLLEEVFGASVKIRGSGAGLHVAVTFLGVDFTEELVAEAAAQGVIIYPAHIHSHSGKQYRDTLLFGFGMLPEERIEEGFRILHSLVLEPGRRIGGRRQQRASTSSTEEALGSL